MTLAVQACQGHPANLAPLDQRDLRERLVQGAVRVLWVSLALLDLQESVVCLACLVLLALLAAKESVERLENKDRRVSEVTRVPMVRLVCLVLLVPSVPQVKLVPPALTASPDLQALLAAPETRVLPGVLGARAAPVHLVYLAPLVPQDR